MALGNILNANPTTHDNSQVGKVIQKLNELVQQEGVDVAYVLRTDDPTTHIRFDTASGEIQAVLAGTPLKLA